MTDLTAAEQRGRHPAGRPRAGGPPDLRIACRHGNGPQAPNLCRDVIFYTT